MFRDYFDNNTRRLWSSENAFIHMATSQVTSSSAASRGIFLLYTMLATQIALLPNPGTVTRQFGE